LIKMKNDPINTEKTATMLQIIVRDLDIPSVLMAMFTVCVTFVDLCYT